MTRYSAKVEATKGVDQKMTRHRKSELRKNLGGAVTAIPSYAAMAILFQLSIPILIVIAILAYIYGYIVV